jgi:hypothetical protein
MLPTDRATALSLAVTFANALGEKDIRKVIAAAGSFLLFLSDASDEQMREHFITVAREFDGDRR